MAGRQSPALSRKEQQFPTARRDAFAFVGTSASAHELPGVPGVVTCFADGDAFLASPGCYEAALYVIGGEVPLRDGIELVRLLRRRTEAPILCWRSRAPAAAWLDAGADLWLPRSATQADLEAGIRALRRRRPASSSPAADDEAPWVLVRAGRRLQTPRGVVIPLGETDFAALGVFLDAQGETVPHAALSAVLGHASPGPDNALHATMYRLRRRVERATPEAFPMSARAGVGYVFRAPITSV